MSVRRVDERQDERTTILRVTIPKKLLNEIRATKRICRENGLVFDIKPDVRQAIERAIAEAHKAVSEGLGKKEPA